MILSQEILVTTTRALVWAKPDVEQKQASPLIQGSQFTFSIIIRLSDFHVAAGRSSATWTTRPSASWSGRRTVRKSSKTHANHDVTAECQQTFVPLVCSIIADNAQ